MEVDGKSEDELLLLSRQILKRRNEVAKSAEVQSQPADQQIESVEAVLKKEYSDYSLEFPTVFETIVRMGLFYAEPFKKYIQFRKKQPRVYTKEEDSLRDLCKYPLLLWKFMNPHYDQNAYLMYKQQLQEEIKTSYRKTKQEFKAVNDEFTTLKQKRADERRRALASDTLAQALKIANAKL